MRINIAILLLLFSYQLIAQDQTKQEEDYIFFSPAQKAPKYKYGTDKAFVQKIYKQLKFPNDQCLEGTTVLSYLVNKEGQVEDAKIVRSISDSIDNQLLRLIYDFEFIPGEFNGKAVPMQMNLPIRLEFKEKFR